MINKKIPIILDGDPGHDDAIAWVLAAACPQFDIKAITTVAGNQTLEKVTYNAQRIATLLNLDIEVAKGRPIPMATDLIIAPDYHGESGLDGPKLPEPKKAVSELSAIEMMIKVLEESDEKVTIVSTGPQTNVAALLIARPDLKEKIERVSIMGGGLRNGNWTTASEFNILVDPESCKILFESGVPIYMSGLDVTERAIVYPEEWEKIRELNNPVASVVAQWFDFFFIHLHELGWDGATLHDPCAVMSLIHPEIFEMHDYYVDVETTGRYCRGETVPDYLGITGKKPNVTCITNLDREKFVANLIEACKHYENWEVK